MVLEVWAVFRLPTSSSRWGGLPPGSPPVVAVLRDRAVLQAAVAAAGPVVLPDLRGRKVSGLADLAVLAGLLVLQVLLVLRALVRRGFQ